MQPPKYFLDRSLGLNDVPAILRRAGLDLITLAEHYGLARDQDIKDVTWLDDATKQGWICLTKDKAITRNPAELNTIRATGARCVALGRGDLTSAEMAGRFLSVRRRMDALANQPGPFLYVITGPQLQPKPLPQ